jgi:hypothetical protein
MLIISINVAGVSKGEFIILKDSLRSHMLNVETCLDYYELEMGYLDSINEILSIYENNSFSKIESKQADLLLEEIEIEFIIKFHTLNIEIIFPLENKD